MPNSHPNAAAGGLGGSLGVVIVFGLRAAGLDIPPGVEGAIAVICGYVVLLVAPGSKRGE